MVAEPRIAAPHTASESPAAPPAWRDLLIDRIVELNPSAEHEFLGRFEEAALERYASHLEAKLEPRGKASRWIRTNETPAGTAWRAPKERLERLW